MNILKLGKKRVMIPTLLLIIVSSGNSIFIAKVTGTFIDVAIRQDVQGLINNIVLAVTGLLFFFFVNVWVTTLKNSTVATVNLKIKALLFSDIFYTITPRNMKEILSMMTNELKQFETKSIRNEFVILQNLSVFLLAFAYSLFLNYQISFFFLLASVLPVLLSKLLKEPIEKASKQWNKENSAYTGELRDYLAGRDSIINYDAVDFAKLRFSQVAGKLENTLRKMTNTVEISNQGTITAANIFSFSIAFGFGIYQVIKGNILLGSFMSLIQVSNYLVAPILNIIAAINEKQTANELSQQLASVLKCSRERVKLPKKSDNDFQELKLLEATIAFNEQVLFKPLNLTIHKGDKILISAPSGVGKSTLLRALGGFIKFTEGRYLLNGVDVDELSQGEMMRQFSLIKQEPFVFDDSLMFNLTMGKEFSKQAIKEVVNQSGLEEVYQRKGLDFQVGEKGKNLSGGQLQRIEIGRGLLADRPVILADEITSALDLERSREINKGLLCSDKTVIEVSHKPIPEHLDLYTQIVKLEEFKQ